MTDKAVRSTVQIGGVDVEGYQMPDGGYQMSQTTAAQAVGMAERNARDFLNSKAVNRLLGEGYTPAISQVEVESGQARGQTRINALPLEVVAAYWVWQCFKGNRKALSLVMALSVESLERRFDSAFGVSRTEADYNERLSDRIEQMQSSLDQLSEAYAEPDVLREHIERLEAQVRRLGEEPLQIPDQQNQD